MADMSYFIIKEEEDRVKRECEEEGIEYEPLFSIGSIFDVFSSKEEGE